MPGWITQLRGTYRPPPNRSQTLPLPFTWAQGDQCHVITFTSKTGVSYKAVGVVIPWPIFMNAGCHGG